MCNGWCSLDPSKVLSLLDNWNCPAMMTLDVVPVCMIVEIVETVVITNFRYKPKRVWSDAITHIPKQSSKSSNLVTF